MLQIFLHHHLFTFLSVLYPIKNIAAVPSKFLHMHHEGFILLSYLTVLYMELLGNHFYIFRIVRLQAFQDTCATIQPRVEVEVLLLGQARLCCRVEMFRASAGFRGGN